jgi:hypothetical protein
MPSGRIAAGRFEHDLFGKPVSAFPGVMLLLAHDRLSKIESPVSGRSCENARQKRA